MCDPYFGFVILGFINMICDFFVILAIYVNWFWFYMLHEFRLLCVLDFYASL